MISYHIIPTLQGSEKIFIVQCAKNIFEAIRGSEYGRVIATLAGDPDLTAINENLS